MKKLFLFLASFIVILALLLIIANIYLQKVIVPQKIRALVVQTLSEKLGRKVELGDIKLSLLRGAALSDLVVFEKDNVTEFAKVKQVSFNLLIFPIFKEKKIIIPVLNIDSPSIKILRNKESIWNFADIPIQQGGGKKAFSVLIYKVKIKNGFVSFYDEILEPAFARNAADINAVANISLPADLKYKLSCRIQGGSAESALTASGSYNFISKEHSAALLLSDLLVDEYAAYYSKYIPFKILNAKTNLNFELDLKKEKEFKLLLSAPVKNLEVSYNKNILLADLSINMQAEGSLERPKEARCRGVIVIDEAALEGPALVTPVTSIKGKIDFTQDGLSFQKLSASMLNNKAFFDGLLKNYADPYFEIKAKCENFDLALAKEAAVSRALDTSYKDVQVHGAASISASANGKAKDQESLDYNADIRLLNVLIKYPQKNIELEKINGKIIVKKDILTSSDLTAEYKGVPALVLLNLENFKDPSFKVDIYSKLDAAHVVKILPADIEKKLKDVSLKGRVDTETKIQGKLKPALTWDFKGTAKIQDGFVDLLQSKTSFTNISGTVNYTKDYIASDRITIYFRETPYFLSGSVKNFAQPLVDASVKSETLSADIGLAVNENVTKISKCKGKYYNSTFDIIGDITGFQEPLANLYGNIVFDIADSPKINPSLAQFFDKYNPRGILNGNIFLNGPTKQPKDMEVGLKASSGKVLLKGLAFNNLKLDLRMKDKVVKVPSLTAVFYDGSLSAQGTMGIDKEKPPYSCDINMLDVNLSNLIKDTDWKNKNITGLWNSKLTLKGELGKPESYKGDGWVRIRDGYLWEAPFLGELARTLFLASPDMVAFNEASGTFTIKDKQVSTQDLTFYSQLMKISMKGYVDFEQKLSFDLFVNFSEGLAEKSELSRLGFLLLTNNNQFIGEIKIKGTLSKPEFVKKLFPVEKILKEKALDILENILR